MFIYLPFIFEDAVSCSHCVTSNVGLSDELRIGSGRGLI
jgi:hypothetical protein